MQKKLVIFDFDGVLANTIERSFEIHQEKNPSLTWQKFRDFSNGNFLDGMGQAVKAGHYVIPEDFFVHYDKHMDNNEMSQVLRNTVIELSKHYILSIISSSHDGSIKRFLKKENTEGCFSDVFGLVVHNSKVVKIKMLLEKYQVNPVDAVFITDSLGDIREASECGVPAIAVLWGLHERETLEKGNPARILETPDLLLNTIKEVLGN